MKPTSLTYLLIIALLFTQGLGTDSHFKVIQALVVGMFATTDCVFKRARVGTPVAERS